MTARRSMAVTVLVAAGVVGAVGTYASVNQRGFVALYPLDHPLMTWAVVWVLALVAAILWRPRWRVVALLALPVIAAVYLTGFEAMWLGFDERVLVARQTSADGRHEIRLLSADDFIDPYWEVRVRSHRGLLSRDRVVWQSSRDAERPTSMRFVRPHTVEIVAGDGRVYDVSF